MYCREAPSNVFLHFSSLLGIQVKSWGNSLVTFSIARSILYLSKIVRPKLRQCKQHERTLQRDANGDAENARHENARKRYCFNILNRSRLRLYSSWLTMFMTVMSTLVFSHAHVFDVSANTADTQVCGTHCRKMSVSSRLISTPHIQVENNGGA